MNEPTALWFNWAALIGAPIVAGGIAGAVALASARSELARRRGFRGTVILGVVLGGAAGVVIDILHPGYMPPATFVLAGLDAPLSAGVGFVVGNVCARSVHRRHQRQDRDSRQVRIDV